jgi:hypothetical protein
VDDFQAAMTVPVTLWTMGGLGAAGAFFGWRGARPWDPRKGPRMIPWRLLMLLCAALELTLLIHLVALFRGP